MFIPWDPAKEDVEQLGKRIGERAEKYRKDYAEYYERLRRRSSPKLRDSNPSVVVVPGLGLFGFGKDKREARITSEFFVNAIHVMAGANALEDDATVDGPAAAGHASGAGARLQVVPQLCRAAAHRSVPHRILGARRSQAAADAAREGVQPQGRRRRSARGSGIGREVALEIAKRGGHVVVADANVAGAEEAKADAARLSSNEMVMSAAMDLTSRDIDGGRLASGGASVRRVRLRRSTPPPLSRRRIRRFPSRTSGDGRCRST